MANTATTATTTAPGAEAPYELSIEKQLMDMGVFLFLLFGIFYFMLIRPQQKRFKSHKALLESVKKGSTVITGGGIIGTVTKLEGDNILIVEIAQGVKVKVARDTITGVTESGPVPTANDN